MQTAHRSLDLVPIPELGVKAGDLGVVAFVYDDGRGLRVEIGREDGTTAGFIQLEAEAGIDSAYFWRVVAYFLVRGLDEPGSSAAPAGKGRGVLLT